MQTFYKKRFDNLPNPLARLNYAGSEKTESKPLPQPTHPLTHR